MLPLPCSSKTTLKRLLEASLPCSIPARKPSLTDEHKEMRLQVSDRHADLEFWRSVIFTDETSFLSVSAPWQVQNISLKVGDEVGLLKACMGGCGIGVLENLFYVEGILNGADYINTLKTSFRASVQT